ncbi:MAG: MliC family protein [Proteobacteria bacterium]|nr:MliC family protein [Pseudomonadota bacterium]MDA0983877.1 MliC family protein [Pseudomonadota bacterium]
MEQLLRLILFAAALLALSACSNINVWPFSEDKVERSRVPANATAYQCDGGRKLYVRMLENGAAAWVILPEREIRLEKTGAAAATNYSYRGTLLEVKGDEAALLEGSKPVLTGCKAAKS